MLETRGLTWAWFIHFVPEVLTFGFMAIGAIAPGGLGRRLAPPVTSARAAARVTAG